MTIFFFYSELHIIFRTLSKPLPNLTRDTQTTFCNFDVLHQPGIFEEMILRTYGMHVTTVEARRATHHHFFEVFSFQKNFIDIFVHVTLVVEHIVLVISI